LNRSTLTAPEPNARFAETFYGQARGVVSSGFDECYFESSPETEGLRGIPEEFVESPADFLRLHGEDTCALEFIASISLKDCLPGEVRWG